MQSSSMSAPPDAGNSRDIQIPDVGQPDVSQPACPDRPSMRPEGSLRTIGCEWVQRSEQSPILLRGVVISGDGVGTPLGTSDHESTHFAQLRQAGAVFVWLLVQWRNIEPFDSQYDGAYMRRVCRLGLLAKEAGLAVCGPVSGRPGRWAAWLVEPAKRRRS